MQDLNLSLVGYGGDYQTLREGNALLVIHEQQVRFGVD